MIQLLKTISQASRLHFIAFHSGNRIESPLMNNDLLEDPMGDGSEEL
jgi:hypothetical protein